MSQPDAHGHDDNHGGHGHDHPPHLAHHFDSPRQQFDAAKVGMWVFLATEILMFGGLFCAYAVWRANHPEVFLAAHKKLDVNLGLINTIILITSSFTMAWAVRAAQLNQRRLLVTLLSLTIAGGCGFLVVKTIEYSEKWDSNLWVGQWNLFSPGFVEPHDNNDEQDNAEATEPSAPDEASSNDADPVSPDADADLPSDTVTVTDPALLLDDEMHEAMMRSAIPTPPTGPQGLSPEMLGDAVPEVSIATGRKLQKEQAAAAIAQLPEHVRERWLHQFFQVYFLMTGLHTFHVIVGIGLIGWITIRSAKGDYNSNYYTPVDLVGLYWHLVDLIWIFLFPLLYLIH